MDQYGPTKDDPRRVVLLLGPLNDARTRSASIALAFFKPGEPGSPYQDPQERLVQVEGWVNEPGERIRQRGRISLDGRSGLEVVFDVFGVRPDLNPRVMTTEWLVATKDDDYIFELSYIAASEDFDKYAPLFEKMLQTFRFQR